MNGCALVATYHKTGTAWMSRTFKDICKVLGVRYVSPDAEPIAPDEIKPPIVLFDGHAFLNKDIRWLLDVPDCRILHLVRDPRDVIISAMHYHRISGETWLHQPRDKFDEMTYQEKINSLPSNRERYLFEMDNSTGGTIKQMVSWDYSQPRSFECKYENLVQDSEMRLFAEIVAHLGFSGEEIEECRKSFWRMSLFGGFADKRGKTKHIRSGEARQWPGVFDRALGDAFLSRFGRVLVRLGYEPDNSWAARLPLESEEDESAVDRRLQFQGKSL